MPESGEEDAGKLNIWELTEGCICCSMKSDFASSILTIANTIDPEYLIVEPTGVGMLSNVMNNIRLIQYERISLLSPITILDGNSFDRYCQEFPDIYRDQIASAGCVLVSKMEGADRQTLEQLEQSIRQINPAAEIFTTHYSANPDSWWESLLSRPADPAQKLPGKAETPDLQNLGLTEVSLPSGNQLLLFCRAWWPACLGISAGRKDISRSAPVSRPLGYALMWWTTTTASRESKRCPTAARF